MILELIFQFLGKDGAYLSIQGKTLRVSTIGRTFLDMIREPNLCGGIYHVLDVYAEHAPRYLRLIVDKVDRYGSPIDKVRIGYILKSALSSNILPSQHGEPMPNEVVHESF